MKRILCCMVAVALTLASASAHASAVLLEVQGKVGITLAGGGVAKAAAGLELPDGSVVAVETGGKAAVLLESGAVDEVAAGTRYAVGPKTAGAKRTDLGSGIALAMRELSASGESPTVHGMVKAVKGPARNLPDLAVFGAGGFRALFPSGTAIRLGTALSFRWSGEPGKIAAPVLVLDDEQKKHIAIKPIELSKGMFAVDVASLKIVKGKRYSWYLADGATAPVGKTARFEFSTLSAAEEQALDADLAKVRGLGLGEDGQALLAAQLYYEHGMYDDVDRTLAPLWSKEQSSFVKKLLAAANARMGRVEEAKKYK